MADGKTPKNKSLISAETHIGSFLFAEMEVSASQRALNPLLR